MDQKTYVVLLIIQFNSKIKSGPSLPPPAHPAARLNLYEQTAYTTPLEQQELIFVFVQPTFKEVTLISLV